MEFADRNAIESLIFRYVRHVDTCQWHDLGQLFAHAVITANGNGGVKLEGAETIGNYWRDVNRQYDNGTLNTQHIVTNLEFDDLPNGEISVHSCFTVLQATPALPLQPIVAGRYTDLFEKADGKWRFKTKHIDVRLVGNVSQHLKIDLGS
jgi:3-phenylpropionate/cinnamic acid dioxygenase small subunit